MRDAATASHVETLISHIATWGTVVILEKAECCGLTWTSDAALAARDPRAAWCRDGRCGVCEKKLIESAEDK